MTGQLRRSIGVLAALAFGACASPSHRRACGQIVGTWTGVGARSDGGGDPAAMELVTQLARNDRWRITRITDTGLQRERVNQSTGRVVGDAMYVRQDLAASCVVDVTTPAGPRPTTFVLLGDGTMAVQTGDGWYAEILQRAR